VSPGRPAHPVVSPLMGSDGRGGGIFGRGPKKGNARPGPPPTTTFRAGPARTGDLGRGRLPERPALLWKLEGPAGFTSPVVAGGALNVGDRQGTLYAIDPRDGTILWRSEEQGRDICEASKPAAAAAFAIFSNGPPTG